MKSGKATLVGVVLVVIGLSSAASADVRHWNHAHGDKNIVVIHKAQPVKKPVAKVHKKALPKKVVKKNAKKKFYRVKPGDTLFKIQRKTGVSWKKIARLNNLKGGKKRIYVGQRLRLQPKKVQHQVARNQR